MQARQKLGAPGRHQLRQLEDAQAPGSQRVSLFLRGGAEFSSDELEQLVRDGAQIRTTAGNILTVDVPIDVVDRVLSHDFVVAGDLSAPLYRETDDEPHFDIG